LIGIQVNVIPDIPNTLLTIVASLILYFIFRRYAWSKVKTMLDNRANLIANNLSESEEAKNTSLELQKEYEEKLREAKNEASDIIANARAYSDELKAKAIKESKEEAKKEYEKGVKDLELERQKVLSSVNDDIIDMAMLTASKVLNEKSDNSIDRSMVEKFVLDMGASNE